MVESSIHETEWLAWITFQNWGKGKNVYEIKDSTLGATENIKVATQNIITYTIFFSCISICMLELYFLSTADFLFLYMLQIICYHCSCGRSFSNSCLQSNSRAAAQILRR